MTMDSIGGGVYEAFEFYYIRTMGEKLDNKLEWSTHYMFDSFNYKNIEDIYYYFQKEEYNKLLDAEWCNDIDSIEKY